MEKALEILKNVAIVILALIVAFILFIGLGKLAKYAISSLASAGASLTSVFVPATSTPVLVVAPDQAPPTNIPGGYSVGTTTTNLPPAHNGNQGEPTQTTAVAPAPVTTTHTTTYIPAQTTYYAARPSYYGLPDLSVSVVSTGIINTSGVFVPQSVVYPGQRAAAQILVTNIGTNVSGSWVLRAPLPTVAGNEVFTSTAQQSLAPGQSLKLILSFDDLRDANTSSMVITIDPYNAVNDSNRSNNQTVATFVKNLSYGNGNYNAGYTYPYNGYTGYNGGYNNTYPYNTYNGLPDLSIRIIGVSNASYNGGYIPNGTVSSGNQVAIEVQVTNNGSAPSGNYTFNAMLNNGYSVSNNYSNSYNYNGYKGNQYTSNTESSLLPGQTTTYTISAGYPIVGSNTARVTINPTNSVQESNYANNTDTATFQVY